MEKNFSNSIKTGSKLYRSNAMHKFALPTISTLEFLESKFVTITIGVGDLATITGEHQQTIRNALSCGKYPIVSFKVGSKRRFLLRDVAQYIDLQLSLQSSKAESLAPQSRVASEANIKKRRGRPTKAEQIARQRA